MGGQTTSAPRGFTYGYMLTTDDGPLHRGRQRYEGGRTYSVRGWAPGPLPAPEAGIILDRFEQLLPAWRPGAAILKARVRLEDAAPIPGTRRLRCRRVRVLGEIDRSLIATLRRSR